MTQPMTYDARNRENLAKLGPNTRKAALAWYAYCCQIGCNILIYETIRTLGKQKENVAKGSSQTMRSYHLVGQALDFVPIRDVDGDGGEDDTDYNGYGRPEIQQAIAEAKRLGFTWGGDWGSTTGNGWDKPHLEYPYKGYGTDREMEEVDMSVEEANQVIDALKKLWAVANIAGSDELMKQAHDAANACRRASGQPEE